MSDDKKKIMVVDDDDKNRKLAVDILGLHGYQPIPIASGQEFLDILGEMHPDLILLDINLPDVDGFDLFKIVRGKNELDLVKVVAWTAMAMREEQETIKQAGFDYYISKPINVKQFVQDVKMLLAAS